MSRQRIQKTADLLIKNNNNNNGQIEYRNRPYILLYTI